MLCQSAERLPEGREWRYEPKLDGFRAIGRKSRRSGQLWSRNQKDFTRRFPQVVKAIAQLPNDTIIDGEIVALDEHGKPSFNLLQWMDKADGIVLYAFDLLMLSGRDMRQTPLSDRREALRELMTSLPVTIRYSETFNVPLAELTNAVRKNRLEGIVAKRAGSHYRSGERSADWLKWRANRGQEFVIGGYLPSGDAFDSILVGYYEGRDLIYAGSIRAGIPREYRRALLPSKNCQDRMPIRQPGQPWPRPLGLTGAKMAACRWLDPFIVVRVELWTTRIA
jgi:bifunctional non-homologous end joining protein LigD